MACVSFQSYDEYDNPEIYEAEYGRWKGDFPVFLDTVTTGSALDLACGTGRLTIELAKAGLACTGIDGSRKMLDLAVKKSPGLDISYIYGDICSFQLDKKFDLITLAGNSFQALLTEEEQDQMLECVKDHLKPTGLFVFNTRNPASQELYTTEGFEFWHDFIDFSGNLVKVFGKQVYNPSKSVILYTTKRVWKSHEATTAITLRFTDMQPLQDKLGAHGFKVINAYGDFDKSPFHPTSPNIILVCRQQSCSL